MSARDIIEREIVRRGSACEDCGRPYERKYFNWHHRDPNIMQFRISAALHSRVVGLETELERCDLLCLSCHRRRHPFVDPKTATVAFDAGPPLQAALDQAAAAKGLSVKEFVRFILIDYTHQQRRSP